MSTGQTDSLLFRFVSEGQDKLLDNMNRVGLGAKGVANGFSQSADHIGNSAKKIVRDFDVMGDKSSESTLKVVDAVGGLMSAIGSGGLLTVIGLVSVGFAAYNAVVNAAAERTKEVTETVKKLTDQSAALATQIVQTQNASAKELDEQRRVALETIRLNGLKMGALLTAYRLQKAISEEQAKPITEVGGGAMIPKFLVNLMDFNERRRIVSRAAADEADKITETMTEFHRVNEELRFLATDRAEKGKVAVVKEAAIARDKINKASADAEAKAFAAGLAARVDDMIKADADESAQRERQQASMEADADARARSRVGSSFGGNINFDQARADYNQLQGMVADYYDSVADGARITADKVMSDERATFSQRVAAINRLAQLDKEAMDRRSALRREELNQEVMAGTKTRTEVDALIALDEQLSQSRIQNRMAERDIAVATLTEQKKAQDAANMAAVYASQVQLAHAATMMVVQPVVSEFTGELERLGTANRENYRELDAFSDELPAIIAKKSQAIMAGIAAEATGKAVFELGEAAAMTALGLGYLAIPGLQGQAAPAFASAAQHGLAAVVYGSIAGVSVGGAVGIGAMRGDGGLVPLTRAEREEMDKKKGKDKNSDRLGGSSEGSSDAGERVLNIIVQNSAPIFGGDDAAAEMLALPLARASRSYFGSRMQEG